VEVESLRSGERQIVAKGETPPGISVELCLNALPNRLTCGLEGERLSIEGHSDVAGQGAPGGRGVCGLCDEQGGRDRPVFLIMQAVGGFDLQCQRTAVNGCDTNVQRMSQQNRRCLKGRLQEEV